MSMINCLMGAEMWKLSIAIAFLVVFISHIDGQGEKNRTWSVHNQKLDIALTFDESKTVFKSNYKEVFGHIRNWIQVYYERSNDTRFAVIGCSDRRSKKYIVLSLNEGQSKKIVLEAIDKVINFTSSAEGGQKSMDNRDACFPVVMQDVFNEKNGDRPDAENVFVHITDCNDMSSSPPNNNTIAAMAKNQPFVICLNNTNESIGLNSPRWEKEWEAVILKWLLNDKTRLIIHKGEDQLREALNKLLPKIEVLIEDCYFIFQENQCEYNKTSNQCETSTIVVIIRPLYPPESNGKPCAKSKVEKCDCTKADNRTKIGVGPFPENIAVDGSNLPKDLYGFNTSQGGPIISQIPYQPLKHVEEPTTVPSTTTTEVTTTLSSQSTETEPKRTDDAQKVRAGENIGESEQSSKEVDIIPIIIGVIVCLFLAPLVIIAVVVTRRRRSQKESVKKLNGNPAKSLTDESAKMANIGLSKEAKEKVKGVQVDFSISDQSVSKNSKSLNVSKFSPQIISDGSKAIKTKKLESTYKSKSSIAGKDSKLESKVIKNQKFVPKK